MTATPFHHLQWLEAILDNVADAITAQDPEGRLVYANAAAAHMLGFDTAEALLAAPVAEVVSRYEMYNEDRKPVPLDQLPGRQALLGFEPEPLVVRYRPVGEGGERWSRIKARPLRDEDTGQVLLAINVIEDITEIKQAEYRQRFLSEAGRVLFSSLDYEHTLATVARLAVPEMADWCAVDLAAPGGHVRVATAHVDPAKLAFAEELSRRYPADPHAPTGVPQVLRSGEPELYPDISDDMLVSAARDEEHLELLRSAGMVSVMLVPMKVRDHVLGVITMVSAESGRRFGTEDLQFAEALAIRAGAAVENARLYSQRSSIARTLQESLLPPGLPEIERLEAASLFRATGEGHDVGGDFYDLFPTGEHRWFALIGDVCGKGAAAAATTALVRYTIRAAAVRRQSPAAILRWLNDAMLRQETGPERFCTLAIARLDIDEGQVSVTAASGGHPLPRILRADDSVDPLGTAGTLIGVTPDVAVEDRTSVLHAGDTLVLFTDGLTESRAPAQLWSPEELDAALVAASGGSAQELVDRLGVAALGGLDAHPRDDVAILALRAR